MFKKKEAVPNKLTKEQKHFYLYLMHTTLKLYKKVGFKNCFEDLFEKNEFSDAIFNIKAISEKNKAKTNLWSFGDFLDNIRKTQKDIPTTRYAPNILIGSDLLFEYLVLKTVMATNKCIELTDYAIKLNNLIETLSFKEMKEFEINSTLTNLIIKKNTQKQMNPYMIESEFLFMEEWLLKINRNIEVFENETINQNKNILEQKDRIVKLGMFLQESVYFSDKLLINFFAILHQDNWINLYLTKIENEKKTNKTELLPNNVNFKNNSSLYENTSLKLSICFSDLLCKKNKIKEKINVLVEKLAESKIDKNKLKI